MKVVLISDTHKQLGSVEIPEGDILIHAGDLTGSGSLNQMLPELAILGDLKQRFKHIIVICGNHDFLGEENPEIMRLLCKDKGLIYLDHEAIEIEGFKIFGSAYTPEFFDWAFNVPRGEPLAKKWAAIPDDTDILVTHGPPNGILDLIPPHYYREGQSPHVGCEELLKRVIEVNPKIHVFGHIHHSYGKLEMYGTTFVNASICDEKYYPGNRPVVVEIFNVDGTKYTL